MPGFRPALVILLLSLGCGGGSCGEVSDSGLWVRLIGTLIVVFDLFKGTGSIWSTLATPNHKLAVQKGELSPNNVLGAGTVALRINSARVSGGFSSLLSAMRAPFGVMPCLRRVTPVKVV